jgi:transposase
MRESMEIYPRAAAERAMKLQEVLLRATTGKIKWWQAAELIGISERQLRRRRKRYEEEGYQGLLDRRRRKPSSRRVAKKQADEVLGLYRDKYFDLNVRHFHEKLGEEHQIGLSYTWVKQALQGAGLVKRKARRGVHRKRRERRPLPGMMLHIDGSEHHWFQDERKHDLIVILDDATSDIYYAQLAPRGATLHRRTACPRSDAVQTRAQSSRPPLSRSCTSRDCAVARPRCRQHTNSPLRGSSRRSLRPLRPARSRAAPCVRSRSSACPIRPTDPRSHTAGAQAAPTESP